MSEPKHVRFIEPRFPKLEADMEEAAIEGIIRSHCGSDEADDAYMLGYEDGCRITRRRWFILAAVGWLMFLVALGVLWLGISG